MNNNEKFCAKYFFSGVILTLIILTSIYKFDLVFEQSLENNSNYIKKSEIEEFLKYQNKAIVEKNSYVLKQEIKEELDLKEYKLEKEKEKNIKLNSQKENLNKEIKKLKLQLSDKIRSIKKLKENIQSSKEKTININYANDFEKPILIFYSKDTSNIDIHSKKEVEKLKNLNIHKSVIVNIEPCKNNFEDYSRILGTKRVNSIKNTLKEFIDIRKIRINDTYNCEDPVNENIFNEKNIRLVLGAVISFEKDNYH